MFWERGIIQSGVQRMEQPQRQQADECFRQPKRRTASISQNGYVRRFSKPKDEMEIVMTVAIGEGVPGVIHIPQSLSNT